MRPDALHTSSGLTHVPGQPLPPSADRLEPTSTALAAEVWAVAAAIAASQPPQLVLDSIVVTRRCGSVEREVGKGLGASPGTMQRCRHAKVWKCGV